MTPREKIALFRSLFRGREDVYAKRFESQTTGRSGYQPACANEWIPGVCEKPKIRCAVCPNRRLLPITDDVIYAHLVGTMVIGAYPMLLDDMCLFLAMDFDKADWLEDIKAVSEVCTRLGLPRTVERSRSGKGGHVWFFFEEAIPAVLARKLGSYILTETMESRPEAGLDSYDRLFPNQDTLPRGGFGNLIALPLQTAPRKQGNSVFLDEAFVPFSDQWAFLSSVTNLTQGQVEEIVGKAERRGRVMGVRMVVDDEAVGRTSSSPFAKNPAIKTSCVGTMMGGNVVLPERVAVVVSNEIFIEKEGLPATLINRLIRVAAFQNPEFYKAQAMRLPTYMYPREPDAYRRDRRKDLLLQEHGYFVLRFLTEDVAKHLDDVLNAIERVFVHKTRQ
ncbi:MAG: hypothetical protein EOL87_17595 [Spartobacteria bacterium]|nr:hypothetical protein [Spartobacteria bacterium]